jgi:HAD superfamily hydrolase (TIGR01450 family)
MHEIKKKKLFLLDMDGTIYHENTLIHGALDFFKTLTKQGKYYVFMTNNSSKNKEAYIKKLISLGIEAKENNIVSSVNATIQYLKKNKPNSKLYLVGTKSFKEELINEGFHVVPFDCREMDIDYVLVGFDTELSYEKIEGACFYISRGIEYIATNIDLRCPIKENRYIPDCGAICNLIGTAVDVQPKYLGKPNREIVNFEAELWNVQLEDIICIGDRLYTDILCGINAGVTTAVVFTGEAQPCDIISSEFKPDYCFYSINDIYNLIKD